MNRLYFTLLVFFWLFPNAGSAQLNTWRQIHSAFSPCVYAITLAADGTFVFGTENGIFLSTDPLDSRYYTSLQPNQVPVREFHRAQDGRIFAVSQGGEQIFVSEADGSGWQLTRSYPPTIPALDITSNSDGDLFIAFIGGIDRSTDGGSTWTTFDSGLLDTDTRALFATESGVLVLGTLSSIYRSTDNGVSWSPVVDIPETHAFFETASGTLLVGSETGVLRSSDDGATWVASSTGIPETFIHTIEQTPGGLIFAGVANEGVYASADDGLSWSQISQDLQGRSVTSMGISAQGLFLVGTYCDGLFYTPDSGTRWLSIDTEPHLLDYHEAVLSNTDVLLTATSGGDGVYGSDDVGESWSIIGTGLPFKNLTALAVNEAGDLFAGSTQGIFRLLAGSETWTSNSVGLGSVVVNAMDVASNGHVLAATAGQGVYVSADNADSWSQSVSGPVQTTAWAVESRDDGLVLAGTNNGVFVSNDNGVTWESGNAGFGDNAVTSFGFGGEGDLFAGSIDGTFRSLDGGLNWAAAGLGIRPDFTPESFSTNSTGRIFVSVLRKDPFGNCFGERCISELYVWNPDIERWSKEGPQFPSFPGRVSSLVFDDADRLYATTKEGELRVSVDGGLFVADVSVTPTAVEEPDFSSPTGILLEQNYPNPFSHSSEINYSLSRPAFVRVELFNVLGQRVRALENGFKPSGGHTSMIERTGLSPGLYVFRITTETGSASRKLIIRD